MSAALMNQLRESLLLERAKRLYHIAHVETSEIAIETIKLSLRLERDEGIHTGIEQAQRFADELRKVAS